MKYKLDLPKEVEEELKAIPKEELQELLINVFLEMAKTFNINCNCEDIQSLTYSFD